MLRILIACILCHTAIAQAETLVTRWPASLPCARPTSVEFEDWAKSPRAVWSAQGHKPTLTWNPHKKLALKRGFSVDKLDLLTVELSGLSTAQAGIVKVGCAKYPQMVLWRTCPEGICIPEVFYPSPPRIVMHGTERDELLARSLKLDEGSFSPELHDDWIAMTRTTLAEMSEAIRVVCIDRCSERVDVLRTAIAAFVEGQVEFVRANVEQAKAIPQRNWKVLLSSAARKVEWQCLHIFAGGRDSRYCVLRFEDDAGAESWLIPMSESSALRTIDVELGKREGRIFWQLDDSVTIEGAALRLRESLP